MSRARAAPPGARRSPAPAARARVRGAGTGSPSIAIRRSGKRSGGRSAPHAGHQTAEKLAWGSMNRPGNGRPCERKALRLATAVSAARPTPTATIADSVARESDGPSSPLSAIGCHNIRAQGSCQDGSDRRAGIGVPRAASSASSGRPRPGRRRRSRPRRCRSRDECVPPARRGAGRCQIRAAGGFRQRPDVAREPAQRLPDGQRRQEQPTEARGPGARVVARRRARRRPRHAAPHPARPARARTPAIRPDGSGTGRVASSARQIGSSAARHAARSVDDAIADLEAVAEAIARVEDARRRARGRRRRRPGTSAVSASSARSSAAVRSRFSCEDAGRGGRRQRRSPGWNRRRRCARSSAAARPSAASATAGPEAVVRRAPARCRRRRSRTRDRRGTSRRGVARRDRLHPGLAGEIVGAQRGAVVLAGVVARRITDRAEDRRAAPAAAAARRLPQHVAQVARRPPGAIAHRDQDDVGPPAPDRRRDRRREIDRRQVRARGARGARDLEQPDVRRRTHRQDDARHRGAVTGRAAPARVVAVVAGQADADRSLRRARAARPTRRTRRRRPRRESGRPFAARGQAAATDAGAPAVATARSSPRRETRPVWT